MTKGRPRINDGMTNRQRFMANHPDYYKKKKNVKEVKEERIGIFNSFWKKFIRILKI